VASGSSEPSFYVRDICPAAVGRDYVVRVRQLAREAAQVAGEERVVLDQPATAVSGRFVRGERFSDAHQPRACFVEVALREPTPSRSADVLERGVHVRDCPEPVGEIHPIAIQVFAGHLGGLPGELPDTNDIVATDRRRTDVPHVETGLRAAGTDVPHVETGLRAADARAADQEQPRGGRTRSGTVPAARVVLHVLPVGVTALVLLPRRVVFELRPRLELRVGVQLLA